MKSTKSCILNKDKCPGFNLWYHSYCLLLRDQWTKYCTLNIIISYIYLCFDRAISKSLHKWSHKALFISSECPGAGENYPRDLSTFNYCHIGGHSFYSLFEKCSQIQFFGEISPDWVKMSRTGFENTKRIVNVNWRVQVIFFHWKNIA